MTCGFSSCTRKGICSSCAKEASGDSVPEVSSTLRTPSATSCRIAMPGWKHQYDSVGVATPPPLPCTVQCKGTAFKEDSENSRRKGRVL